MDQHARNGRASDISSIKRDLHIYIPDVTLPSGKTIPRITPTDVRTRDRSLGYYSLCTGRLLTNINERADFDADPEE